MNSVRMMFRICFEIFSGQREVESLVMMMLSIKQLRDVRVKWKNCIFEI